MGKGKIWIGLGFLLAAAVAWWLWSDESARMRAPSDAPVVGGKASDETPREETETALEDGALETRSFEGGDAHEAVRLFHGQLWDAASDGPAGGLRLELRLREGRGFDAGDGPLVTTLESDAEGRFAYTGRAPEKAWTLVVLSERHPRMTAHLEVEELAEDGGLDLGRVVLPVGVPTRAQLVDTRGRGVAGRELHIGARISRSAPTGRWMIHPRFVGRTDEDGLVECPDPLPLGRPWAEVPGLSVLGIEGDFQPPRADLSITVRAAEDATDLGVRVLDGDGRPVLARVDVVPEDAAFAFESSSPTTGVDGRKVFERRTDSEWSEGLRLHVKAHGCRELVLEEPIPWGTHDHELRLQWGPELELRVRHEEGATPIERYGVRLVRLDRPATGGQIHVDRGRDLPVAAARDGVRRFPVRPGRFRLEILPPEEAPWAVVRTEALEVDADDLVVPVTVPRHVRAVVEVVDGAGRPREGSRVHWRSRRRGLTEVVALRNLRSAAAAGGKALVTDEAGRVEFSLPVDAGLVDVIVRSTEHPEAAAPGLRFRDGAGPHRIVVTRGGRIRGKLEGWTAEAARCAREAGRRPELQVRRIADAAGEALDRRGSWMPVERLAPGGAFSIGGLESGLYAMAWTDAIVLPGMRHLIHRSLGEPVPVRPGRESVFHASVKALLPREILIHPRVQGVPVERGSMVLRSVPDPETPEFLPSTPFSRGLPFDARSPPRLPLLPGLYRVGWREKQVASTMSEVFEVTADGPGRFTPECRMVPVSLVLHADASGTPLAHAKVEAHQVMGRVPHVFSFRTDANGRAPFERIAPGCELLFGPVAPDPRPEGRRPRLFARVRIPEGGGPLSVHPEPPEEDAGRGREAAGKK